MAKYLKVLSTGVSLPDRVLTNSDLERMVDTSDDWIVSRTGIRERRISEPGISTGDLGAGAAAMTLERAGWKAEDVDILIVATATGDYLFPSTACVIQSKLGATRATAFDISAACSGFLYGLTIAYGFLNAGIARNALIIGAETLTKVTDYTDRSTCVLFGDGAGAMLVTLADGDEGLFASHLGSDGNYISLLNLPAGGSRNPTTSETVANHMHYIKMNGNELFKVAVRSMAEAAEVILEKTGLSSGDVDLLIPHQANIRIIQSLVKRLRIEDEKVYVNIERFGNTSAASIPIAYHEARSNGLIDENTLLLMLAFGGGITWGGVLMRG